jgi:tetratricopeptide (TPR) repeat protein
MGLITIDTLKCPSCGAAVLPSQARCQFCGTPVEVPDASEQPEAAPLITGNEQFVDYYALLGISVSNTAPPDEIEIRQGALEAQQRAMLGSGADGQHANKLLEEIEIGSWILSDSRARNDYNSILFSLRNGHFNSKHLDLLHELQREARRELGMLDESASGAELLQQGIGYQTLGMHHEAAGVLKQAVLALPDSVEAHYRYGLALLGDESDISKSSHNLRQAIPSFEAAATLDPSLSDAPAYAALCRGLLAREQGDRARSETELRHAVSLKPDLGIAWRALAALALQAGKHDDVMDFCRRALLKNSRDEQAYLLLVASCWQAKQRDFARDAAGRVANIRGDGWTADRVLKEVIG